MIRAVPDAEAAMPHPDSDSPMDDAKSTAVVTVGVVPAMAASKHSPLQPPKYQLQSWAHPRRESVKS